MRHTTIANLESLYHITNTGGGEEESAPLDDQRAARYRAVAATVKYVAQDRPDIQFCAKEAMRRMAGPSVRDEERLKRIIRYLKGVPRLAPQPRQNDLDPEQPEALNPILPVDMQPPPLLRWAPRHTHRCTRAVC